MSALEWNVGLGFSWLPYIGQWCRLVKSERTAIHGTFLGWGLILNVAAVFGALATLAIGFGDPTDWIVTLGGTFLGVIGLIMLIIANTTSAVVLMYTQALSFKTQFPRWRWGWATATTIPAAVLMLSPSFYDAYGTFLTYVSFIMSIMAGIMVVDYFMRRGRVEVGALYDRGNPHYEFPLGINPSAIVAALAGSAAYWLAYNPVSGESGLWFAYLAAGVPSFFVAALVYWVGMGTIFARYRKLDREWLARVRSGDVGAVVLPGRTISGVEEA
jgi:NCS1 family nucleobase:cation symporter-1